MHKDIMKTYFSVSAQNLEPHAKILTASHFDINHASNRQNTGRKKIAILAPSHNFVGLYDLLFFSSYSPFMALNGL